jgi:putative transposase
MAVWRRQPQSTALVHSDQGGQFSSCDCQGFLKAHNLQPSISREGNGHDNAEAESFLQLSRGQRVRRKIYLTRNLAKQGALIYSEMFYNQKSGHSVGAWMSPLEYEKQHFQKLEDV